jgi:hypothetical protein
MSMFWLSRNQTHPANGMSHLRDTLHEMGGAEMAQPRTSAFKWHFNNVLAFTKEFVIY